MFLNYPSRFFLETMFPLFVAAFINIWYYFFDEGEEERRNLKTNERVSLFICVAFLFIVFVLTPLFSFTVSHLPFCRKTPWLSDLRLGVVERKCHLFFYFLMFTFLWILIALATVGVAFFSKMAAASIFICLAFGLLFLDISCLSGLTAKIQSLILNLTLVMLGGYTLACVLGVWSSMIGWTVIYTYLFG